MLTAAQQLPSTLGGNQTQIPPSFGGNVGGVNPQQMLSAAPVGIKPERPSQGLGLGLGVCIEPPSIVSKQALAKALR